MLQFPRFHNLVLLVCVSLAAIALSACTDARDAKTPGELFHCATDGDCLAGWTCQCGYCQTVGVQQFPCGMAPGDASDDASLSDDSNTNDSGGADSLVGDASGSDDSHTSDSGGADSGGDGGSTDAMTNELPPSGTMIGVCNQSVSADVVFAACNLANWSGCSAGYGCYYGPAIKQTLCKKHTSFSEGLACDPCNLTECGLASDNHPLICDAVDSVCRRTCDATVPLKTGQCPTGQQCYQLIDDKKVPYPSTGGICAP